MQAFVDPTLCIGCTQCAAICPEVFHMDGTLAHAMDGAVPDGYVVQTTEASQSCPAEAISLQN